MLIHSPLLASWHLPLHISTPLLTLDLVNSSQWGHPISSQPDHQHIDRLNLSLLIPILSKTSQNRTSTDLLVSTSVRWVLKLESKAVTAKGSTWGLTISDWSTELNDTMYAFFWLGLSIPIITSCRARLRFDFQKFILSSFVGPSLFANISPITRFSYTDLPLW